jgi:hypothetical protein
MKTIPRHKKLRNASLRSEMMTVKINKFALIFSMAGSLVMTSYTPSVYALEINKQLQEFKIAKTPDERQPEAVQQGIEQIPVSRPSPSASKRNQPINSPIPVTQGSATPQPTPTSQPSGETVTPTQTPARNSVSRPAVRRSVPANSQRSYTQQPRPAVHRSVPSRSPALEPSLRQSTKNERHFVGAPAYRSFVPKARRIDFVNIALGVLAPGDFNSQGRYFHFYQFEGRENQLVQIRLTGSGDRRRSSNLSLDPYMMLLDPNNHLLVKRGSGETPSQGGVKDAFIFVRLPVRGIYTIAVTSRNPGEIGRYSLALRNDRASYAVDELGNLTASSLSLKKNGSPYSISKFEGKKGQLVSIRVDSLFEEFPPYIVLLNSKGQIVAADNDKDGRYTALIDRAKLPEDGTYYVVVLSAIPQQKGAYRLTVF